ncbi:MAG TPA: polysaccharide lyase family 8 super-sandwich domain-containing protein [Phycisphaerae bacterium]|nr:polysaccharide lyase family 8 super-sandwich domain-containing protein [Phycisphaerae bacterium]HPP20987.1 polysaccharide lyase family 8 super-sandwich domain-containing protein [Phycisphaerae bacterium]
MQAKLIALCISSLVTTSILRADDLYHIQRDELQQIKRRMVDEWTYRNLPDSPLLHDQVKWLDARVDKWLAAEGGYWSRWKEIGHPEITLTAAAFAVPKELARVYTMPASRHHRSPQVRTAIEDGLKYLQTFAYPGCPQPGNWWAWQIGMPMSLIPLCMMLEKDLDPELLRREIETVEYLLKMQDDVKLTGGFIRPEKPAAAGTDMNKLWHHRLRLEFAVLVENPAAAGKWAHAAFGEMGPPGSEALQADWSYKFHGANPMWAYGRAFLLEYALLIGRYEGTYLGPSAEQMEWYAGMLEHFVDGFLYRGRICPAMIGREISRGPRMQENAYILASLAIMARSKHPRAEDFARRFHRERRLIDPGSDSSPRKSEAENLRLWHVAAHVAGVPAVDPAPPVNDVFAYPDSDFLQVTRPDWAVGIKLHSRRNAGYESINGENLQGWFLSHGSTFYYLRGDEWDGCWPTLDWTRLPGTTVCTEVKGQNQSPFVGVLRGSSQVTLAAMEMKCEGFTARKSWLVDGDAIVCLGSGIDGPGRVETTVINQPEAPGRNTTEPEAPARDAIEPEAQARESDTRALLLLDNQPAPAEPFDRVINVRSIWFQNVGYVFPGGAKVRVLRGPRSSDWSSIRDPKRHERGKTVTHHYLTVVIEHGPEARDYCYVMLPNVEPANWPKQADAALQRYATSTDGPHIVRTSDGQVESVVLWTAGQAGDLQADRGCMTLRIGEERWATDPAWVEKPLSLNIAGKAITLPTARGRAVRIEK